MNHQFEYNNHCYIHPLFCLTLPTIIYSCCCCVLHAILCLCMCFFTSKTETLVLSVQATIQTRPVNILFEVTQLCLLLCTRTLNEPEEDFSSQVQVFFFFYKHKKHPTVMMKLFRYQQNKLRTLKN